VTITRLIGFSVILLLTASFAVHGQPRDKVARLAVVLFDAPDWHTISRGSE